MLLLLVAGGCADRLTLPPAMVRSTSQELARLTCVVSVKAQEIDCQPAGATAGGGLSFDQAIVGGQGLYVRLTSSGLTYASEIFAFDVTVQNLMSLPMGTGDGSIRHAAGVRVFFHEAPIVTAGTGSITIENATGVETFLQSGQPYYQYGGTIEEVEQTDLGPDGILSSSETSSTRNWQFRVPESVETFAFQVLVAAEVPPGAPTTIAPQVSAISPATLVPGMTATITGTNFDPTPVSNVVTIGGRLATVTGGTTTDLQVTVPCVSSGVVSVRITTGGRTGVPFNHALEVTQHTVAVGEVLVLENAGDVACNELTAVGGAARYVVAVFSSSTTPNSNTPFQISADPAGGDVLLSPPTSNGNVQLDTPTFSDFLEQAAQQKADEIHDRILEGNRRILEQYGSLLQAERARGAVRDVNLDPVEPPLTRSFRVANINVSNFCSSYYVVAATRVYYNGKIAIYEDDATPDAFKESLNAVMASNYQRIGDQFNADMEPILTTHFGDVLRRDAETDNNGVVIALSTPRINTSFPSVAGFVASCDQFANDDANDPPVGGPYTGSAGSAFAASNHGEVVYVYQPVTNAPGYAGNTPENWYRTIRSTVIHETKHAISQSARVANGAPSEHSWLEEGTARHAEELWGRLAVDNLPWKGNTGYGSAANPVNIYCDMRPSGWPECAANTRRPASIMQRHFTSLYTHMFGSNARLLSPFGAAPSDNASYFYAISWSLIRYAIDRYATDEASFFQALTQSSTSGVTNLTNVAGTNIVQLLGSWAIALAVDDHPLWGSPPGPDARYDTWHFRSVYAGLNTDFPGTYTLAYPLVPSARSFGTFAPASITTLRGGGSLWYELSGTQSQAQLLRLEANGGGAPPSTLRVAVTRLQ
jgi:hypothetical protein